MSRITAVVLLAGAFAEFSGAQTPPADPGKAAFLRICSGCHETDVAMSQKLTRTQWEAVVGQMVDIGAPASDAEFTQIVNYLAANYGPAAPAKAKVNVNTASAKELADGLSLTAADGDAIVAYRTKSGKFATLDDVKKVPGIDTAKIDAAKDRISFQP